MTMFRQVGLIGACLLAFTASPALAEDNASNYPSRPIHLIVGFAAGGGNDVIARIYGQKLSEDLGQPVIVENRPGAGAIVATGYVAKATPDGYTLLIGATGMAINQAVYAKLPYDSVRDFVAISELASFPLIMVVNASSSIKSVADFVTFAKANPDKTNYSSASATFQLVTELFRQKTGAPMLAIPYKSANEMVLAVISGQVSPQVKAGKVRALAITAPKRVADFPDLPTMKEAGADVDAIIWTGVFAPKATPAGVVKKLESEFMKVARRPDVAARLKAIGVDAVGTSSDEFAQILKSDIARWG